MSRKREIDPEFGPVLASIYLAFENGLARCERLNRLRENGADLDELRPEALAGAREIAYAGRATFEGMLKLELLESIPAELSPVNTLGALARLGYALVALAEEDPEPEALLTQAELDGLIAQYEIEDFIAFGRERSTAIKARDA